MVMGAWPLPNWVILVSMQGHSSELEGPRRLFTGLVVVEGGVERDKSPNQWD